MAQHNDRIPHDSKTDPSRSQSAPDGSSAPIHVREDDDTTRDSFVGTDRTTRSANTSWGAIFAGAVTFLAVMLLFALVSAGLGLSDVGGVGVGIWSVIAMLLALAAAGFVAGALAVRAGLLHGIVTWATSLVAMVLLIGWLGVGALGAIGGAVGGIVNAVGGAADIQVEDVPDVSQEDMDAVQEQADEATQDAQQTFEQNQDELAAAAWWGVGGLVLGAAVAGFAGVAGARMVHTRRIETYSGADRREYR